MKKGLIICGVVVLLFVSAWLLWNIVVAAVTGISALVLLLIAVRLLDGMAIGGEGGEDDEEVEDEEDDDDYD